jgi:hypothetical protein
MCIVKSVNIIAKYRKANKAVSNIKSQEKKPLHALFISCAYVYKSSI